MKRVVYTFAVFLIVQPMFLAVAMAEPADPEPSPQEMSAGLEKCWNWFESLSDFQPYLPAKIPSQQQWVQLGRLTARKCKLRGQGNPGGGHVAEVQARLGDTDGLLETFREFGIEPKHQGRFLAKLAFATKSEPKRAAELRGDADFYRTYCFELADEYDAAGQFDKAIETLLLLPGDNDYWLIVPFAKAGQLDKAMEMLSSMRDKWNPYYPEQMLASYLAKAGKKNEARKLMTFYLADLRRLKSPDERLREAYSAARLLKQIGDDKERRSFLTDCELWDQEARARDNDLRSKSAGAFSLARIAMDAGDNEFARKSITRAITLLQDSSRADEIRLAEYASLQASLGMVAQSKQTAKEALAIARATPDDTKRDSNLSAVADHFASYRNDSLVDEIDSTIREIGDITWRALAIRGAVELSIRHEQWDRAKRHLAEGREFLRRKDIDRAEAFVHQVELDLFAARLLAKQGEIDAARKLLQELLRRGYSPLAGDFTKKVFDEQEELGFLEDAWRTATWILELDERYSALGSVMESAMDRARNRQRNKAAPQP